MFKISSVSLLRFFIIAVFFFQKSPSIGQKVIPALPYGNWHVQEMNHAVGNFASYTSYRRSVIPLPEGGFVAAVRFDGLNWGVVRVNAEGKMLWQSKTKGEATGIARFKDDFIVVYNDAHEYTKAGLYSAKGQPRCKATTAALINGSTGKVSKEKILHTSDKAFYTDSRILTSPDGQFANVLIRVTTLSKGMNNHEKEMELALASERIILISLDGELNARNTEIHTPAKDELFMGAEGSKDGSFFLASLTDEEVVIEQFQKDGKRSARLSAPISLKKFWNLVEPVISFNPLYPDVIFFSLYYLNRAKDRCNQVFEFNFSTKKVSGPGEHELTNGYYKSLDFQKIKGFKSVKYKPQTLKIVDVVVSDNRIAVIKEIPFYDERFTVDGVIVEIYDRKWTLQKTLALDRHYEAFTDVGRTMSARLRDSKLELIIPAIDDGIGGNAKTLLARIDLEDGELEEYKILDRLNIKKNQPIEGSASVWFPGGVYLQYVTEKGGLFKGKKDYDSHWHKVEF